MGVGVGVLAYMVGCSRRAAEPRQPRTVATAPTEAQCIHHTQCRTAVRCCWISLEMQSQGHTGNRSGACSTVICDPDQG